MSSASFLSRSTRPLSSSVAQVLVNKSDIEFPDKVDFLQLLELAWSLKLPSITLQTTRKSNGIKSQPEPVVLGQGLTSKVTLHSLPQIDESSVKSQKSIAVKNFTDCSAMGQGQRHRVYTTIINEVKILCHPSIVGHPNIVRLHSLAWEKGSVFPGLAMECSAYGSLDQLIRGTWPGFDNGQISSARWHLTLDIAMGLCAIHEAGISHGDLKPENILLMNSETDKYRLVAKLTDFGGSMMSNVDGINKPLHHTPLWSAPEILHGDPDVDWMKADVYSFGLVVASLWLAPRDGGGFGIGRAGKTSCCFLSSFVSYAMTKRDEEEILLYVKSVPDDKFSDATVMEYLKRTADKEGVDEADKVRLFESLTSTVNAYFWLRPEMKDIGLSLSESGDLVGRNVSKEMGILPSEDIEDGESFQFLDMFSIDQLNALVPIMMEQAGNDLDTVNLLTRDALPLDELEDFYRSSDVNLDKKNDDDPDALVQFLSRLKEATRTVFLTPLSGENLDEIWGRVVRTNRASLLPVFIAAMTLIVDAKSQKSLQIFEDMVCAAAIAGNGIGICLATLRVIGNRTEVRLPISFFLVVLTLSGSSHAAQLLFESCPQLFDICQKLIQAKPCAFDLCKPQFSQLVTLLPMQILQIYIEAPTCQSTVSARQALDLGLLRPVREMIQGAVIPEDFKETIPSLMHGLSKLPDTEAALLAPAALELGGRLSFCASTTSSVAPSIYFNGRHAAELSPLCAAIRRGKSQLALALLDLHKKSGEPIIHYRYALELSCLYLQCNVAEALFRLRGHIGLNSGETDEMCLDWEYTLLEITRTTLRPLLAESPFLELERQTLLGSRFLEAYEKTLQVLIRHGASTILTVRGVNTSTPLSIALRSNDMIATRIFLQALEHDQERVTSYLLAEESSIDGVETTALTNCLIAGASQTFDLLLQTFPALGEELMGERGGNLAHILCSASFRCAQTLLKYCPNVKDKNGHTPLAFFLIQGNMEGVYSVVEYYSATDIQEIVDVDPSDGTSVCFHLLANTPRSAGSVQAFQWLVEHGGLHLYGPVGIPAWYQITGRVRPNAALEQRLDARLFSLLLFGQDREENLMLDEWDGKNILQHAAGNGHIEIVRLLLSKGIDINRGTLVDNYETESELTSDIRSHEREKHVATPLDIVLSMLGGARFPPEVTQGGFLAVQKWVDDLEEIAALLTERGGKSLIADKVQEIMEKDEHLTQNFVTLSTFIRNGQPITGTWPAPLPQSFSSSMKTSDSMDDDTESGRISDELVGEFVDNIRRFFYRQDVRKNVGKMNTAEIQEANMEEVKWRARRMRAHWRLSPDWYCFAYCDDEQVQGRANGLYVNNKTLQIVPRKPGLFRGEEVFEEVAKNERQEKATENCAKQQELEMVLEEVLLFLLNKKHSQGSSPPSLSMVVAKIMFYLGMDQNRETGGFREMVSELLRYLKAEVLVGRLDTITMYSAGK